MLDSDRWARVRRLLEEVVDLSPDDRRRYLTEACKGAPDVRDEVDSLLHAHDAAGAFLEPAGASSSDEESAAPARVPALKPGTRLGCFEIISTLGAGGMGEVYRARDTRLDRRVAIKVLLPHLATDPVYRERFEREARAISRLSHPHICVLHDFGRAKVGTDGDSVERQFLVMELLEGETLAARVSQGPLALDRAITYAIQIAEALGAAHSDGIVHRDLKPSNIMLTRSGVKLLDFGLARLRGSAIAEGVGNASHLTNGRPIAGTLPYMSPEQVRGEGADARSDIFALGAVLYEMIAGRRAFAADSRAGIVAMILERDPIFSDLRPGAPPTLELLVKTCLAKDPAERWQHAHDLVLALKGIREVIGDQQPVRPIGPPRVATITAWALAAAATVALGIIIMARAPAPTPRDAAPRRLMFDAAPVRMGKAWSPAVSSDERTVAFLGADNPADLDNFYIRYLDTGETRQLTHIKDVGCGSGASWSSDGRTLLYLCAGQLRAADPATGSDRVLSDATTLPTTFCEGVTQSANGTIVIGGTRLQRLMPGQQVFRDVASRHSSVTLQVWPSFLPNGRDFLYAQAASDPNHQGIFLASLDSHQVTRVLPVFSNAVVASTGHLVYGRDGSILAQPFDQERRSITGEPTVLASGVTSMKGYTHFALGAGHTLVYVPREDAVASDLVWYDRAGSIVGKLGASFVYRQVAMSPDGRHVVIERATPATPTDSLSVLDVTRGTMQSLNITIAGAAATTIGVMDPVWSPDSRQIAFSANLGNEIELFVTGLNPSDRPVRLTRHSGMAWAEHWSRDGKLFLYGRADSSSKESIWALPLDGDRQPFVVVDTPSHNDEAQLSPDGRWLAYTSDESGYFDVYVQPFNRPGVRQRLSPEGGGQPKWRADGRELFFFALDGTMMSASVQPNGEIGTARALFRLPLQPNAFLDEYTVTPDGQRFLIITPVGSDRTARMALISDWTALVRK
jgi:Tol biopolymer transport system component